MFKMWEKGNEYRRIRVGIPRQGDVRGVDKGKFWDYYSMYTGYQGGFGIVEAIGMVKELQKDNSIKRNMIHYFEIEHLSISAQQRLRRNKCSVYDIRPINLNQGCKKVFEGLRRGGYTVVFRWAGKKKLLSCGYK